MLSTIALAGAGIVVFYLFRTWRRLNHNIAQAKSIGLPYIVQPLFVLELFWLATNPIWLSLFRKILPKSWQGFWFQMLDPEWVYKLGYAPFAEIGSDVFFTVSPKKLHLFVADADVITQITTRRNDFPKPLDLYSRLDIFGKNVVSTEGDTWRMHRKVTAPSFNEKNNGLVFLEALHHVKAMLTLWTGPDGKGNRTVEEPDTDIMRFALYVISRAGFDLRVLWPHEEESKDAVGGDTSLQFGTKPAPGHSMSYREALSVLLENIIITQAIPPHVLAKSPIKFQRDVGIAAREWRQYMEELYEVKKAEVASGQKNEGMDLFAALIKGSGILDPPSKGGETKLEESDLIGNAFIVLLAGHETTANALHFSLISLAMYPESQKLLQKDVDKALQGKPTEEWVYEEEIPKLFNGMAAAVINETLRLYQPVINIPKSTLKGSPQPLTVGGRQIVVPGNSHVSLSAAVHRNPHHWPSIPDKNGKISANDLDQFKPERWLHPSNAPSASTTTTTTDTETSNPDDKDLNASDPLSSETSAHLFKPAKGAFIPFSDGYRSCVGRKFAQVELLVAFAVIFQSYTVELAVDRFATDAEIEAMPKGGEERRKVWQQAFERADYCLNGTMTSMITLQMRGVHVPLRFVRRGEERFDY